MIGFGQHIIVPEAQDLISFALKECRSPVIIPNSVTMLASVQLDDQHCLWTNKIRAKGTNRHLSTKLPAAQPTSAQT
jgi:hypothetical protein